VTCLVRVDPRAWSDVGVAGQAANRTAMMHHHS
jgi:hypothetical protein